VGLKSTTNMSRQAGQWKWLGGVTINARLSPYPCRQLVHAVFVVAILLTGIPLAGAQSVRVDLTVDSVLTIAKEAAEAGATEADRVRLRAAVADAIKRLGRDALFGSYVAEAHGALRQFLLQQQPYGNCGAVAEEQQRLRVEEAKRLFVSGDPAAARQRIGRGYFICDAGIQINDFVFNWFCLYWELESGHLAAALNRFRTTEWKSAAPTFAVPVARAYIVAGRQAEIPDILFEINERFQIAAEQGVLGDGAVLRSFVNAGHATAAVDSAQAEPNLRKRVAALTIIAEALMGIPGLPDEKLRS
jgi:hypothetical protein